MNLVSIVTPYYKKRKFFYKTILSVKNQTYQNFELIIIYDDTDKNDYEFIEGICKNDQRIKILKNNFNLGAGESRNQGINISKGKYIAFLDADDLWHEQKLEKQMKFMENNDYYICHTSYEIINEKNIIIGKRISKNFLNFQSLLKSCDIGLSTVMIKREILKKDLRFPKLKTKEDFVLWLNLLKQNYKIMALDENLTFWRKLNNSLSSAFFQKLQDGFKVYYKHMDFGFFKSFYLLSCLCFNFLRKK
ncbi:MAG: hypothetical protein CBB97_06550 [Candidatus Endolissoclinum sp. TMED37]|nr:MAG: hypothetical protein CBB97_06550 [Candidatus Endolissoclinum sp. TMED37]|tara:strand:+ start:1781 stop:2524 length:744 start_codon:yes stop_codon:yes gene_type:complete